MTATGLRAWRGLCLGASAFAALAGVATAQAAEPRPMANTVVTQALLEVAPKGASPGTSRDASPDGLLAARRAELSQARQDIEKRYAQEAAVCRERFAVTACIDDARARQRTALAPLRDEGLRLDQAQRQARAAAKQAALAARAQRAAGAQATGLAAGLAARGAGTVDAAPAASPPLAGARSAGPAPTGPAQAHSLAAGGEAQAAAAGKRIKPRRAASAAGGGSAAEEASQAPRKKQRRARQSKVESAEQISQRADRARAAAQRREQAGRAARERIAQRQAARAKAGRVADPLAPPGR
jgi:colicin import membrane protein